MSTQFGGGKTHALTALYHLANNGEKANKWNGVSRILQKAGLDSVPLARVAVFVGADFDPIAGRGEADEPKRKTIWGEIAWQLGGEQAFSIVKDHDAKGVAPGGEQSFSIVKDHDAKGVAPGGDVIRAVARPKNWTRRTSTGPEWRRHTNPAAYPARLAVIGTPVIPPPASFRQIVSTPPLRDLPHIHYSRHRRQDFPGC